MPDASHLLFYLRILQLPSDGETLSNGREGGLWQTEGLVATIHVHPTQFSLTLSGPGRTLTCANGPKFASFPRGEHRRRWPAWWYMIWRTAVHWTHVCPPSWYITSPIIVTSWERLSKNFIICLFWDMNFCMDDYNFDHCPFFLSGIALGSSMDDILNMAFNIKQSYP